MLLNKPADWQSNIHQAKWHSKHMLSQQMALTYRRAPDNQCHTRMIVSSAKTHAELQWRWLKPHTTRHSVKTCSVKHNEYANTMIVLTDNYDCYGLLYIGINELHYIDNWSNPHKWYKSRNKYHRHQYASQVFSNYIIAATTRTIVYLLAPYIQLSYIHQKNCNPLNTLHCYIATVVGYLQIK